MGNPLSPVPSTFFLEHVESDLIVLFQGLKPYFFVRYIDDILAAAVSNFILSSFLSFLNSFYPSLKFTYQFEVDYIISFLDALIIRSRDSLKFNIFVILPIRTLIFFSFLLLSSFFYEVKRCRNGVQFEQICPHVSTTSAI